MRSSLKLRSRVAGTLGAAAALAAGCGLVQDAPNGLQGVADAGPVLDGTKPVEDATGLDAAVGDADARTDAGSASDTSDSGPPMPFSVVAIFTGPQNTCAVLADTDAKCWGASDFGTLGSGSTKTIGDGPNEMGSALAPLSLGTGKNAASVAPGWHHSCALLTDGTVKCWGTGALGALGYGDTADRGMKPNQMGDALPALALPPVQSIHVAQDRSCALLTTGELRCWGTGQADLGGRFQGTPLDPGLDFGTGRTVRQVALGPAHSCVILDNDGVKCWGAGISGILGDEQRTNSRGDQAAEMGDNLPYVNLGVGRTAKYIAIGTFHTCAVLDNDRVKCWGRNDSAQLGNGFPNLEWGGHPGEMGDNLPYVELGTGVTVKTLALAYAYSCALLSNNQVKCWGQPYGYDPIIGFRGWNPAGMGDNLPFFELGTSRSAKAIVGAGQRFCVLLDTDRMKCWGVGGNGALGYGDPLDRYYGPNFVGDKQPYIDLGP